MRAQLQLEQELNEGASGSCPTGRICRFQRSRRTFDARQPLLYAALACAAGIVVGTYCWRPALWWVTSIAVFALSAGYLHKKRALMACFLALAVWFSVGALSIQLRPSPPVPDIASFSNADDVLLTAHVVREGLLQDGSFGAVRQSIDVESEEIKTAAATINAKFRIRLSIFTRRTNEAALPEPPAAPELYRYGQRLRFIARLREPRNFGNPGAFNYRDYLREQGIVAIGSAAQESVEVLSGFSGNRIESLRSNAHRQIVKQIHVLWPSAEAALIDAAVIGEDSFISRDTRVDFQRSGTYHLLVVSGLNLSILAFVVFWFLRQLRASDVAASVVTMLVAGTYAFLTDVGAPVWRATLMLACYLGSHLLYRERSMLNSLGAAALGLMIVDPKSALGASFQLTFLSVLIVAALAIPLLERTSQPYRRGLRHIENLEIDAFLEPRVAQFRLDVRMIGRRLARFTGRHSNFLLLTLPCTVVLATFELLLVSALMQVGMALPMAWYFHRVTILALPANVLAIPVTELLMPSVIAAIALGFLSPLLAKPAAFVAGLALEGITATVQHLGRFRVADLRVALPSPEIAVAALLALAAAMVLVRHRTALACVGLAGVVATGLLVAVVPREPQIRPREVEFTIIDVGQGDSTLIISPQGQTLLVDAGGLPGAGHSNFDIGEDVISPYLWSRGISRLDIAAVTHGHWDHVGGMRAILANFRPRQLWVGRNPPTAALAALMQFAREQGMQIRYLGAGDEIALSGMSLRVLAPMKDDHQRRPNDDCLALKLTFGRNALLMEGDAEKATERNIAKQAPSAELLKVGHHGSATSTSPELLGAVHPRFATISVGSGNPYGHPRYEVLQRLQEHGAAVYRTDLDGLLTFYLDGKSIRAAVR